VPDKSQHPAIAGVLTFLREKLTLNLHIHELLKEATVSNRLAGLHVDDSIDVYYVLRAVMATHGCALKLAVDRAQFLSEVSKPLDFIIFDGCIPGWELSEYLSDIHTFCKVPFFIYSGNSPADLEPFYRIGAGGVFEKKHGFEKLCASICTHVSIALKPPEKRSDLGHPSGV